MAARLGSRTVVLGVVLFAALYLLGGAMMLSAGLVALFHMPDIFSTGCIIWTGIVIFLSGTALVLIVFCSKSISQGKSYVMLALCLTVLCFSIANITLTHIVEWAGVHHSDTAPSQPTVFSTYLLALLGSCVGLVASLFGTVYVYCTLVATPPKSVTVHDNESWYETHIKRSILHKHKGKSHRKFNFKLTPSPDSRQPPAVDWANGESDLYHVSWVYEDQEANITHQCREADIFIPSDQPDVDCQQALMKEIQERFVSRHALGMTSDATEQTNTGSSSAPSPTHHDVSIEPRISSAHGTPPNNATSTFLNQSTHL